MIMPGLMFSPLLPWPLIAAPLAVALLLLLLAGLRRVRPPWWRVVPLAALALALANPRLAGEERAPIDDVAVILVDDSASMRIGDRHDQAEAALAQLRQRLERLRGLQVRVERVRPDPVRDEGTRLFAAFERAVADLPRRRLAGVMMITDGQIHDVPTQAADAVGVPLHVFLAGRPGEGDRRVVIEQAPSFGIVGQSVRLTVKVIDPAPQGQARVVIHRNGGAPTPLTVPLNVSRPIDIPIEHGGANVVELEVEAGPRELTAANNRTAVSVTGVRDRLRVLLVSGEPHAGERTWRNLLKADPSVDLVHFTILRPPEKDDSTPLRELALISFPIRELFEDKVGEFDLIIFDRYRRRSLMPMNYYANIARYVRNGGGLLMAVGPEFAEAFSLTSTPIEEVLPARSDGRVLQEGFLPSLTETGRRHPVTAGLPGSAGDSPQWGRWLRQMPVAEGRGTAVMAGAGGLPLLLLDRVGQGRVALLLSDTVWLWTRGYEGGGPQAELLRRLAHWLMKEPALEEQAILAEVQGDRLAVTRRSLSPEAVEVTVTDPDGGETRLRLEDQGDGRATGSLPIDQPGLFRVGDGERVAIAAAGSLNPAEFADLAATETRLRPAVTANGGSMTWLAEAALPELRRVAPGRPATGRGWLGLRANGEHLVTAVRDVPLMPAAALLLLALGGMVMAWWREGR